MANLRLTNIVVVDSTTIKATFNQNLDPIINAANITITANENGIPNPIIQKITVSANQITIIVLPMTPFAAYIVTFKSTSLYQFKSQDGSAYLLEDGKTNAPLILGAEDPADPIRDLLIEQLNSGPYNLDDKTLIRDVINLYASLLSKSLADIRQTKNEKYLSFTVTDELKTRGAGPFDRLNEECAYEVIRVGKWATNAQIPDVISYTDFPDYPITLQRVKINSETLTATSGISNFNGLVLTVNNHNVTKLLSLTINYYSGGHATYSINQYGYQIQNDRYDPDYASKYLLLEDNQFKMSDSFLDSGITLPSAIDTITVSYEYKNLGKIVDQTSINITQVLSVVREVTPPILNTFNLEHYPIVDQNGLEITSGGVSFLDPNANPPFSASHPAFTHEVKFQYDGPPMYAGEYAVDYTTGTVIVYGESSNDGTGDYPPAATYWYKNYFVNDLDYIYDETTYEIVSSPIRDLTGQIASVSFNYEMTLIPDIDFKANVHEEILDERIQNRINATNCISVLNTPLTNVFRIYNETSGEVYSMSRFSDSKVYFTYANAPNISEQLRERVSFTDVLNELLIVYNESVNALGTRVLKIILQNNRLFAATEDCIASSFNSSAYFSKSNIFEKELYFDSQVISVTANTDRLTVGDYQIDYENGIVYVGVSASQTNDVGAISYKNSIINPVYPHIIGVSELYHSINSIVGINKTISYSNVEEDAVTPSSFDRSDERFLNGDTTLPYAVISDTITVTDDIGTIRGIYDVYDLTNNSPVTNFATYATASANVITLD